MSSLNPNHPVSQMLNNDMWYKLAFLIMKKQNLSEVVFSREFIDNAITESEKNPQNLIIESSNEHLIIRISSEEEAKKIALRNIGPAQ
jgi:regulation of enolase protein 1 (concanavalin A-like superfamily)